MNGNFSWSNPCDGYFPDDYCPNGYYYHPDMGDVSPFMYPPHVQPQPYYGQMVYMPHGSLNVPAEDVAVDTLLGMEPDSSAIVTEEVANPSSSSTVLHADVVEFVPSTQRFTKSSTPTSSISCSNTTQHSNQVTRTISPSPAQVVATGSAMPLVNDLINSRREKATPSIPVGLQSIFTAEANSWNHRLNPTLLEQSNFTVKKSKTPVNDKKKDMFLYQTIPSDLKDELARGFKILLLMRGVSGSGKSTLAKHVASTYNGVIFSADDFFMVNGHYQFHPSSLSDAHETTQLKVNEAVFNESKLVIVDNTNLEKCHMIPYANIAFVNGYRLRLLEPSTPWKENAKECSKRSVHQISTYSIENMLSKFDRRVTHQSLMEKFLKKKPISLSIGLETEKPVPVKPIKAKEEDTMKTPVGSPPQSEAMPDYGSIPTNHRAKKVNTLVGPSGGESDWSHPTYPLDEVVDNGPTTEVKCYRSLGTQTNMDDFAKLEIENEVQTVNGDPWSLEQLNSEFDDLLRFTNGHGGNSSSSGNSSEHGGDDVSSELGQVLFERTINLKAPKCLMLEKGTETQENELDEEHASQVVNLQIEFPEIDRDLLDQIIIQCDRDYKWIRQLLNHYVPFQKDSYEKTTEKDEDEESEPDQFNMAEAIEGLGKKKKKEDDESEKNINFDECKDEFFEITLSKPTCAMLSHFFGELPFAAQEARTIRLDMETARRVHQLWAFCSLNMVDEIIQAPDAPVVGPFVGKKKSKSPLKDIRYLDNVVVPKAKMVPQSFAEINRHEEMLQKKKKQTVMKTKDIVIDVERENFYRIFPGMAEDFKEEIFQMAQCTAVEAIVLMRRVLAENEGSGKPNSEWVAKLRDNKPFRGTDQDPEYIAQQMRENMSIYARKPRLIRVGVTFSNLRDNMAKLQKQRAVLVQKTKEYFGERKFMLAGYYSQEATHVMSQIKELSKHVVDDFVKSNAENDLLDLHGLYVEEAKDILEAFIVYKKKRMTKSRMELEIVTGYGSKGTIPKIKPAVEFFLKNNKFKYHMSNPGSFIVTIEKE